MALHSLTLEQLDGLTLEGLDALLLEAVGAFVLVAETGVFVLAGQAAGLVVGRRPLPPARRTVTVGARNRVVDGGLDGRTVYVGAGGPAQGGE